MKWAFIDCEDGLGGGMTKLFAYRNSDICIITSMADVT